MSLSVLYPVQTLGQHLASLEAAIALCLAEPDHKPVHKLRTETRRVEALLLLLGLIPSLPEHRRDASTLLRALKKLRRSAGEVRDLDVHRKMLETFARGEEAVADAVEGATGEAELPTPKHPHSPTAETADTPAEQETTAVTGEAHQLSDAAAELREHLGHQREKAAGHLKSVLEKRQVKTIEAATALMKVLETAKDLVLPGSDLLRDAEAVLKQDSFFREAKVPKLDEEQLHTVRKSAKKARYLAETLPGDAVVAEAARRFEALQEAGGQWHDALEIARAARRHFGKTHELTAAYREERDRKLEAYRAALQADFAPKPEVAPERKVRATASRKNRSSRGTAATKRDSSA